VTLAVFRFAIFEPVLTTERQRRVTRSPTDLADQSLVSSTNIFALLPPLLP
jgi:hypothetical protein